ncbi:MAG: hypothetical protein WC385_02000 [Candidatus Paceibacterota bacterium]|jgi:methyl coenzyme M reductase gamma subunit
MFEIKLVRLPGTEDVDLVNTRIGKGCLVEIEGAGSGRIRTVEFEQSLFNAVAGAYSQVFGVAVARESFSSRINIVQAEGNKLLVRIDR